MESRSRPSCNAHLTEDGRSRSPLPVVGFDRERSRERRKNGTMYLRTQACQQKRRNRSAGPRVRSWLPFLPAAVGEVIVLNTSGILKATPSPT